MNDQNRQTILDEEHLRLLAIGYMVSAAMTAFFSLFALIYVFMGALMAFAAAATDASSKNGGPPPVFVGLIFAGFGMAFFAMMIVLAVLKFHAGRCIQRRRSRTYCIVIAAISCPGIPYGTLLGVCTFMVLERASVKALFNESAPNPGAGYSPSSKTA